MHWIDLEGQGSFKEIPKPLTHGADRMNGNAVMFDVGKILVLGGAAKYDNSPARKDAFVIDISRWNQNPIVKRTGSMKHARGMCNSVVLPNGQVVVIGGMSFVRTFYDTNAVLETEIWSPGTGMFVRETEKMKTPRTYHSVAILMRDGRIFVGGGGFCGKKCPNGPGGQGANHLDSEIYTPPYLRRKRTRPIIVWAPTKIAVNQKFVVTLDVNDGDATFAAVRYSAVTHSINLDQRRIPLRIIKQENFNYHLAAHGDRGVWIPGPYWLFAMDKNGTPSWGFPFKVPVQ